VELIPHTVIIVCTKARALELFLSTSVQHIWIWHALCVYIEFNYNFFADE